MFSFQGAKVENKLNFWLDTTLVILFALIIISLFGRERPSATPTAASQMWDMVHYVAGTLMLAGSVVHIILRWDWIEAIVLRKPQKLAGRIRTNRSVDIWLFGCFVLCGVTGLVTWLMLVVLPEPFVLPLGDWSGLHRLSGTITGLIMAVHLALHWKWIVVWPRRRRELHPSQLVPAQRNISSEEIKPRL